MSIWDKLIVRSKVLVPSDRKTFIIDRGDLNIKIGDGEHRLFSSTLISFLRSKHRGTTLSLHSGYIFVLTFSVSPVNLKILKEYNC